MSSPLWMAIEPQQSEIRLILSEPMQGISLKARLPSPPVHPRSINMLLEALSAWYRRPLHAVLDAAAQDVRHNPERWALLIDEDPGIDVRVEWSMRPSRGHKRDRFLGTMGDFATARRLLTFAATGQR